MQILREVAVAQRNKLPTVIWKTYQAHYPNREVVQFHREAATAFSCHFQAAASNCIQANPDTANTVTAKLHGTGSIPSAILNTLNFLPPYLLFSFSFSSSKIENAGVTGAIILSFRVPSGS